MFKTIRRSFAYLLLAYVLATICTGVLQVIAAKFSGRSDVSTLVVGYSSFPATVLLFGLTGLFEYLFIKKRILK